MRFVFLPTFLLASSFVLAQTPAPPSRDFHFSVSDKPIWTDTGIDLAAGDVIKITADSPACPASSESSHTKSPPPLLARLNAKDEQPQTVGAAKEIKAESSGRLFLGLSGAECPVTYAVDVHLGPAAEAVKDMKSKLTTAAQIWLQGQFGTPSTAPANPSASAAPEANSLPASNKTAATASSANLASSSVIDAALQKQLNGLPRRVNDEANNLGDMVNFVVVGSQKEVHDALSAGKWFVADTDNNQAVVNAVLQTIAKKDYMQMPMSKLMLFGRYQDFGYEQAEPIAMVASRHHFRLWKAPFDWKGQTVWIGAGTHDIGFERDQRNGKVTHKIDPAVDGERENIAETFNKSGKAKSMSYYLPPDPIQSARNATGGSYHSDGRVLVVFLQE